MKYIIGMIVICMFANSDAISQIVVNEIMYAPSESTNEWFEIYNAGPESVDLQNWKWKDATSSVRTITSNSIILIPESYIIICQDSVKLRYQFPLISAIIIQTTWSALNNSGDNLILIDPINRREDSISYKPEWGGNSGGYSLEKLISGGESNDPSNWGTSIDPMNATPGKQNSITPKPFDLFLKSFKTDPVFPSQGETLNLEFLIKNSGQNTAQNFSLNIYDDNNSDSIPQISELLKSESFNILNPLDSLKYEYSIQNIDTGYKNFIAKILYAQDQDTLNNILYRRLFVSSNSAGSGGVVINEIMYDPAVNNTEWIEIYNASGQSVNMKKWKYKESVSEITLSDSNLFLNPGDYFILAKDSAIYSEFEYLKVPSAERHLKISGTLSLNNSGEYISVTDSLNNIIDKLTYSPDWNNPEFPDTKGISLERINPGFRSDDRSNWSSCADLRGGTPGLRNSIFTVNKISASEASVFPNPFSPDGDGYEDFTIINYKLSSGISQMRVKVFDIKGRLVRTLSDNMVTGSEGSIIFNGLGDDDQKLRIGIYILLIEAVDNKTGSVNVIKEPVVIAGKL
ncbi:MAG TPA: lamin tail domain-containing protein [Ignavibacteria bacterium]|nr:lamin tail domain-containing protein [Ignavibacteria bacterium]